MFENIIAQPVIKALKHDLTSACFPPSVLFSGPQYSAKGSAALETARVLCCTASEDISEKHTALWNCSCASCKRHRMLAHPDMIVIGARPFLREIRVAQSIYLKSLGEKDETPAKIFFTRAVRKLLLRFHPVLWEGDAKISKLNSSLKTIEDTMETLNILVKDAKTEASSETSLYTEKEIQKFEKLITLISDTAEKLESEGISELTPVSQIRAASSWMRLTPNGKRKILIIESAEKMKDEGRNSLLKILEEPPDNAAIILCTAKPDMLLPTVLSRLRRYAFIKRTENDEKDIIRRIFHDGSAEQTSIASYLSQFAGVSDAAINAAAAFFLSSIAACALIKLRKKNTDNESYNSALLGDAGRFCADAAEKAKLPRYERDAKSIIRVTLETTRKFTARRSYTDFLERLLLLFSESLRTRDNAFISIPYRNALQEKTGESKTAVEIYNEQSEAALERLIPGLINAFASI